MGKLPAAEDTRKKQPAKATDAASSARGKETARGKERSRSPRRSPPAGCPQAGRGKDEAPPAPTVEEQPVDKMVAWRKLQGIHQEPENPPEPEPPPKPVEPIKE